jgi:16S rRNA (guanine(966)-N(2))-methyltransferase RsmD
MIMLRVISGNYGGQKLKTLPGRETRPTADRVREALFNVLNPRILNCRFLDLYAGSGAVGVEALSRGAEQATFIDANPKAVKIIQENLMHLGLQEQSEVICAKLPEGLNRIGAKGYKFDLVFVDPPYWKDLGVNVLSVVNQYNLLSANGWVIVETAAKETLPKVIEGLECFREKRYGDTRLSYFFGIKNIEKGGEL